MKQFVKALPKERPCFKYLTVKFPGLSDAKLKEGIFIHIFGSDGRRRVWRKKGEALKLKNLNATVQKLLRFKEMNTNRTIHFELYCIFKRFTFFNLLFCKFI